MPSVSINIDVGELDHEPEEFYFIATYVNIACGGHAGDRQSMERAVRYAVRHRARISAHPSFPDREHFGRRVITLSQDDLFNSLCAQCRDLDEIVKQYGTIVSAIKPHGALYHETHKNPGIASTVIQAAEHIFNTHPIVWIAQPGSALLQLAGSAAALREGFADRGYLPDGRLIPRGTPGDLLPDSSACAEQALRLSRSGQFDTICLHSDTKSALDHARAVRAALEQYGFIDKKPHPFDPS